MKIICFYLALLLLFTGCGKKAIAQDCAGYAIKGENKLISSLPSNARMLDVNKDGIMDALVSTPDGSTSLYIRCDEKNVFKAIESSTTLLPQKIHKDKKWTPFTLEEQQSLIISKKHYRLSLLPFQVENNLQPIEINFNDGRYSIDLGNCKALDIQAPLYSTITYEDDSGHRITKLSVQIGKKKHMIRADAQEEFSIDTTEALDANRDGIEDMILYFSEVYGSGREQYAALLLGCGTDAFIFSGRMRVGVAGLTYPLKHTENGFIVEEHMLTNNDPFLKTTLFYQGYYLHPKTLELLPDMRSKNKKKVLQTLTNRKLKH